MDLRQLSKAIIRWWWIGIVPVIVVLLYLGVTYQPPPTLYGVTMRFATGGEPTHDLSDDYDRYYAWLASEYIANGLADIATSDSFASLVAGVVLQQLDFTITPPAVRGAIASDNTQSTTFIYITWHDPDQVVQLARVVSEELIASAPEYYPQMSQLGPVARLIDTPVAYPLPASLRTQLLGPAIRLTLAIAVGFGLILLAYLLDPTIHEPGDLVVYNIKHLGSIPKIG